METLEDKNVGFQKTKVGWIPEEWTVETLGNATSLLTNGFVGKAKEHYSTDDDAILYIQGFNVVEHSFNMKGIKRVSLSFHKKHQKSCLRTDDLLTVQTGDIGLTTIVPPMLEGSNCHALVISRFKNGFYPKFYAQYFNSHIGRERLRRIETGSTMKHLNVGDMKSWYLPVPPIYVQQKIAQILSTWDEAITHTQNLIEQLKLRKKGLMQQLLTGKKRLKGFDGEWKEVKMSDLFTEIKEKNDGKEHEPLTISSKSGFISQRRKFDKVIAGSSLAKYTQIRRGDFSYNKGNSKTYPMGCIFLLESFETAVVPFVYISFRARSGVFSKFYSYWFANHGLDRELKAIITSGARGDGLLNVNKPDFFNLRIPKVPLDEQKGIAEVLDCVDIEISQFEAKKEELLAQKKGLMQQLLTGQKRVRT